MALVTLDAVWVGRIVPGFRYPVDHDGWDGKGVGNPVGTVIQPDVEIRAGHVGNGGFDWLAVVGYNVG